MSPVHTSSAAPLTVAPVSPSACTSGFPACSCATNAPGVNNAAVGTWTAPLTTKGQISEQFCTWLARNWATSAPGAGCTDTAVSSISSRALRAPDIGPAPTAVASTADAHATARSLTR